VELRGRGRQEYCTDWIRLARNAERVLLLKAHKLLFRAMSTNMIEGERNATPQTTIQKKKMPTWRIHPIPRINLTPLPIAMPYSGAVKRETLKSVLYNDMTAQISPSKNKYS